MTKGEDKQNAPSAAVDKSEEAISGENSVVEESDKPKSVTSSQTGSYTVKKKTKVKTKVKKPIHLKVENKPEAKSLENTAEEENLHDHIELSPKSLSVHSEVNRGSDKKERKSKNKLRMFLDNLNVSSERKKHSDSVDQESAIELSEPDTQVDSNTDNETMSLYSNLETRSNLFRRSSTFSLSGLSDTSEYTSDASSKRDVSDTYTSDAEDFTQNMEKSISDTEYNTQANRTIARQVDKSFNPQYKGASRVKFHSVRGVGAAGRISDSHILKTDTRKYNSDHFDGTNFGTMTDNLNLQYQSYGQDPLAHYPKPPVTLPNIHINHIREAGQQHFPPMQHNFNSFQPSNKIPNSKYNLHHNPYKKYRKLSDYRPGRLIRNPEDAEGFNEGLGVFGPIDPMQVRKRLGKVDEDDLVQTYTNPETFDEFYSETELENDQDSSVYYSYDSDISEKTTDSFDVVLRNLQSLKIKHEKLKASKIGKELPFLESTNETEAISLDEVDEKIKSMPKKIVHKKKEKRKSIQKEISLGKERDSKPHKESPRKILEELDEVAKSESKPEKPLKLKKDKKQKKKKDKRKASLSLSDNEQGDDVEKKPEESGILDLDELKASEAEEPSKKEKKSKKKNKKDKKKKNKGKKKKEKSKKKRSLSISSADSKENDADDEEEVKETVKKEEGSANAEVVPELKVDSTVVARKSVERIQKRLAELKQLVDDEEAAEKEAEEAGGDEDEGEAAAGGDNEDEGPEPQVGIQYDPERQICLGNPIKVGTSVWAVDFANGKKFRKAKVVAFTEPATYTVKFGMFRKQPGTQRLDIQLKMPRNKNRKGIALFNSVKDVFKCAENGDVQGVLNNILKDPDVVDKKGGKEKQTALYYAAKNGHEETVKLLLRYGAVDSDDGIVIQNAEESVRKVLFEFGWGKVGAEA